MSKQAYRSFIIPAGRYWIGDPASILTNEEWSEFCDACNRADQTSPEFENCDFESLSGYYETLNNSVKVLAFFTDKGKGRFEDQFGIEYNTSSGMIGLVPFGDRSEYEGIVMLQFTEETLCFSKDGIITFGMVIIDTQ
jgi:hypothetical protein